ncbi:hypothetical protein FSU_0770 [Fibrobacter succinogenes subsp. succinogenes S85]|uniref:Uncharacterized protein n=1 Tax=Fibrobacter succinogenes (strain ATCC 19169 / S85) TaxID=59374 RepID=D9S806_FIBSS|nr:hypothetical protein FSU_0770 [Fibrobacter succinogenes subsp. succinogenes S85]
MHVIPATERESPFQKRTVALATVLFFYCKIIIFYLIF